MSAPRPVLPATISTSGYRDGLGRRALAFDRECGMALECLAVRPELVAFERPLRERADRLAAFDDERFARIRSIDHDRQSGTLTVTSEFVAGYRLSDLIDDAAERPRDENTAPSVDAALGFLLQALPALAALHNGSRFAHGVLAADRLVLTPAGQIVFLDTIYGEAVQRLHLSRQRLWSEFGLAVPASAGHPRMDATLDLSQSALIALALTVGRSLRLDDYPAGLPALLAEAMEIAQLRGSASFASALQRFFGRALPLPARRPYASAADASEALQQLVREEMGVACCQAALVDLGREPAEGSVDQALVDLLKQRGAATSNAPAVDVSTASARELDLVAEVPQPVPAAAPEAIAPPAHIEAVAEEPAPAEPPAPATTAVVQPVLPAAPAPDKQTVSTPSAIEPETAASEERTATAADVAQPAAVGTGDDRVSAGLSPAADIPVEPPATGKESHKPESRSESRRKRRAARRRDTLRSAEAPPAAAKPAHPDPTPAAPAPVAQWQRPVPVQAPPAAPPAPPVAILQPPAPPPPVPRFDYVPAGLWIPPQPVPVAPVAAAPVAPPAATTLRVKSEPPAGFTPRPAARAQLPRQDVEARPVSFRTAEPARRGFPWKIAAAAVIVIAVGVAAGRSYFPDNITEKLSAKSQAAPVAAAAAKPERTGTLVVETEPAGARVLIDGKPAGETPLTIDDISVGQHIITVSTNSATMRRGVKIEAGKTTSVDVPVYSGWLAVFAPIVLDISERGHSLGTTEHGRLMLPPGRHSLTLSNRELGYSAVHKVDIEPGEERVLTVQPRGTISINAQPWAEVFVDGERKGETPIANLRLPLGTRELLFRHPIHGERRVTVVVTAREAAAVSVDLTKPSF